MGGRLSITEIKRDGVVGQQLYSESSYDEQRRIENIVSFMKKIDRFSLYFVINAQNYEPTSSFVYDNQFIKSLQENVIWRRERGETISFVIHSDQASQFYVSTAIHAAMSQSGVDDASYKISLAVPNGFPREIFYKPPPFQGGELRGDKTFYPYFPNVARQY